MPRGNSDSQVRFPPRSIKLSVVGQAGQRGLPQHGGRLPLDLPSGRGFGVCGRYCPTAVAAGVGLLFRLAQSMQYSQI